MPKPEINAAIANLAARVDAACKTGAYLTINIEGCNESELCFIAGGHVPTHADVVRMAEIALEARSARKAGRIDLALRLEAKIDRLYDALPQQFRW